MPEVKQLTINGTVYAEYQIIGNAIYFKMMIQIIEGEGNEEASEDLLLKIIYMVEKVDFEYAGYLNV